MFTKKDRKIANQKSQIENRDKLLYRKILETRELKDENLAVHNENKDLRFEIEEQNDIFKEIINLAEMNKYKNEEAIFSKIKELAKTAINN